MSGLGKSNIPYCTHSWSPSRGCLGCADVGSACWALKTCWRMAHNPNPKVALQFEGLVEEDWSVPQVAPLRWTGTIRTYPEAFDAPLHRQKDSVVFVSPQGDLAHADAETVRSVFEIMAEAQRHQFLVLTKWPAMLLEKLCLARGRSDSLVAGPAGVRGGYLVSGIGNVWLGTSATDQRSYDERVGTLCDPETGWPGNRWVSLEPCMGTIDIYPWSSRKAVPRKRDRGPNFEELIYPDEPDWIVAGSANTIANGAAAFTPEIARSLRDQCEAAEVPFWLKQMPGVCIHRSGNDCSGPGCNGTVNNAYPYCDDYGAGLHIVREPRLDGLQHLSAPPAIESILREAGNL